MFATPGILSVNETLDERRMDVDRETPAYGIARKAYVAVDGRGVPP